MDPKIWEGLIMLTKLLSQKNGLKVYILFLLTVVLFGGAALLNGIAEIVRLLS